MDIEKGIALRKSGDFIASNEYFLQLVKKHPNNALIHYQCAWSFDVLEKETDAIFYYEQAIALGLSDNDLKEALLGLGSTYRSIGAYQKSKEVFEKGMALCNDKSIQIFYAMSLYNLQEYSKAMEIVLKILADTTRDESIANYKKAITFYADKLDTIFE